MGEVGILCIWEGMWRCCWQGKHRVVIPAKGVTFIEATLVLFLHHWVKERDKLEMLVGWIHTWIPFDGMCCIFVFATRNLGFLW